MSAGVKVMAVLVMVVAVLLGSLVLHAQKLTDEQRRQHEAKPIWERVRDSVTAVGRDIGNSIREGIEARKQARVETTTTAKVGKVPTTKEMKADLKGTVAAGQEKAREVIEKADEVRCATCEKVDQARQAGTLPNTKQNETKRIAKTKHQWLTRLSALVQSRRA
jgi:hypothetical protein